MQFTKNEYSEENLLFISEVEEFKRMKNYEDKKLKADEIFTKYLNQNAPQEVRLVWYEIYRLILSRGRTNFFVTR